MEETGIDGDQPLIAYDEAPKMPQPGKRPLDNPPPSIPPQLPPILRGRMLVVAARRDDRLNTAPRQPGTERVAVIPPIGDQPFGALAGPPGFTRPPDGDRVEGFLEERDLCRGSRLQVCSHRSTRAIDQNHPLCALTTLGRANFRPPFFAGMKLPSATHASQRRFWWSLSWAKKARQSWSRTPVSSQCLRRRQQVLGLPYRRGNSRHWAPVHRIQRMPSKQRRSSTRGRPPRVEALGWGRWTRMPPHCCLVSFRHAMCCPPVLLGNS